ncbi:MAG TPA: hypothetical protein VF681_04005 [Abditibacteriaceae bacterium]
MKKLRFSVAAALCAGVSIGAWLAWSSPFAHAQAETSAVTWDGTFETAGGWQGIGDGKSIEKEDANHFLRFKNTNPNEVVAVAGRFALNPAWTRVTMSAKLRGTIQDKGKEGWYAPRLTFQFQNAEGKMVGDWPDVIRLEQSSAEWITVARTYEVPAGAVSISLTPGLWGTSGTFDMDDLVVKSADRVEVNRTPARQAQFRVLTLGDSITAMFRYQPFLRETLKKEKVDALFVGSEGQGENMHEGHSGWSIGQIEDKAVQYITGSNANVVLLQIGVNNMNHGLGLKGKGYPPYQEGVQAQGAQRGKTLNETGAGWGDKTYGSGYLTQRVNGLFDKILSHPNQPILVVAKVPGIGLGNPLWKAENDDADARIREFNTILETAVKARQAKGMRIEIVDNYALGNRAYGAGPEFTWGTEAQQSGDWVHPRPDAAIWKGMATNFTLGINRLLKK